jgi:hypothetical protein
MDSEDTREDIRQLLSHIRDVAHELLAWMEKQDHAFDIAIIHSGICLQGVHTGSLYKCVAKDKAEKSFNQILEDFMNDKGVLNEGLSMILDDVAVLIRLIF